VPAVRLAHHTGQAIFTGLGKFLRVCLGSEGAPHPSSATFLARVVAQPILEPSMQNPQSDDSHHDNKPSDNHAAPAAQSTAPDSSDQSRQPKGNDGNDDQGNRGTDGSSGENQQSDKDKDDKEPKDKEGGSKKPGKKPLIILAIVVVILLIAAFIWWFATRNEIDTDDAYTDGNVVLMAPKVSGYVVASNLNDNRFVHQGDLLFKIDPRDYQASVDQATAQVGLAIAQRDAAQAQLDVAKVQYPAQLAQAEAQEMSAQASLTKAQASYDRQHTVDERATTDENIDAATAQQRGAVAEVRQAQAQVRTASLTGAQIAQAIAAVKEREQQIRQAQAQLEQARLNLSYTEVRAPVDGWVTQRNLQIGSFVQAGSTGFSLVTTQPWVTANFKENQLTRMRVGDAVEIEVDAYPDLKLHGHVDSIQLGSGSRFSAFPAENATGNFVKIVQRVPVKIVIDRGLDPHRPLGVGLSVDPTVTVR